MKWLIGLVLLALTAGCVEQLFVNFNDNDLPVVKLEIGAPAANEESGKIMAPYFRGCERVKLSLQENGAEQAYLAIYGSFMDTCYVSAKTTGRVQDCKFPSASLAGINSMDDLPQMIVDYCTE